MKTELVVPDIHVECFAALAETSWFERRPELQLLCHAAHAEGGLLNEVTIKKVLPGVSDAGAVNILSWCRMLRICDDKGGLTSAGEETAASGNAPIPEQGVYKFWAASHPILGSRILHLERLSSDPDERVEFLQPLPFVPDRNCIFPSVIDPTIRVTLRSVCSNTAPDDQSARCIIFDNQSNCSIRWVLDFSEERNYWRLEGGLDLEGKGALRQVKHEKEKVELNLRDLFADWAFRYLGSVGRWDSASRRIAIPFSGQSEAVQETFLKTLKIPSAEVPGFGKFEDVTVDDIPVGPASSEDAERWARARLDRRIASDSTFKTRSDLRSLFAFLVVGTPLEPHQPVLPDHSSFLVELRNQPRAFWSVAAPVDLSPKELDSTELEPFAVGKPPSAKPTSRRANRVQIPFGSKVSMERLVKTMVADRTPVRVLLCDRYIRGAKNLACLNLLIKSLRALNHQVVIEVITDPDSEGSDNIGLIRTLGANRARTYENAFGSGRKNQPHDRYLLIIDGESKPLAWQMGNSPLDADPGTEPTPTTPLIWRDFAAMTTEPETLPHGLALFFGGGAR